MKFNCNKLFLLSIYLLLGLTIIGCGTTDRVEDKKVDAKIFAQDAIEDRLLSPSSAKFPSYNDFHVTEIGKDKYRVESYVDAGNAYGAILRRNFVIELTITGEDSYIVNSVNLR